MVSFSDSCQTFFANQPKCGLGLELFSNSEGSRFVELPIMPIFGKNRQ